MWHVNACLYGEKSYVSSEAWRQRHHGGVRGDINSVAASKNNGMAKNENNRQAKQTRHGAAASNAQRQRVISYSMFSLMPL